MDGLNELSRIIGATPPESLIAMVILAAFALAAYAIHVVFTIAKRRR